MERIKNTLKSNHRITTDHFKNIEEYLQKIIKLYSEDKRALANLIGLYDFFHINVMI